MTTPEPKPPAKPKGWAKECKRLEALSIEVIAEEILTLRKERDLAEGEAFKELEARYEKLVNDLDEKDEELNDLQKQLDDGTPLEGLTDEVRDLILAFDRGWLDEVERCMDRVRAMLRAHDGPTSTGIAAVGSIACRV